MNVGRHARRTLITARQLNQPRHLANGIDVRAFNGALNQRGVIGKLSRALRFITPVRLAHEVLLVFKAENGDAAHLNVAGGDGAVAADGNLADVFNRDLDRLAALAEHGRTVKRGQLARRRHHQTPVAGVLHPVRRLNGKPSFAVDGDVKLILCTNYWTCFVIRVGGAVDNETHRIARARAPQGLVEHHAFGLERSRIHVGEIVCDDFQFAINSNAM